MLVDIWSYLGNAWTVFADVLGNFIESIQFLFKAPAFTAVISGYMPTFIGVSLIHVVVIAVFKAIFGR